MMSLKINLQHKCLSGLLVLVLVFTCPPMQAASKVLKVAQARHITQVIETKSRSEGGFLKKLWKSLFKKEKLHRSEKRLDGSYSWSLGALILVVISGVSLFSSFFFLLAWITWIAGIAAAIISLIKGEPKLLAILALSIALLIPVVLFILFGRNCCREY